ncbi:MAG: O-antigen ligase family protein [Polaromonas sp.]|nr:O-antigen ligase family protein [Polaromonas sp.]
MVWAQNAAIFACCANLFSTALANLGFAAFLLLFFGLCLSGGRRALDTENFPAGVSLAIGLYIGWQLIGLSYTEAPLSYALKSVLSERKICYILPLALIFSDEVPKRRFLAASLTTGTVALVASFLLSLVPIAHWIQLFPMVSARVVSRLVTENVFVLRSNVTQGMVFALCAFLAFWYSLQPFSVPRQWAFRALAALFVLNIVLLTHGRSGYVVFLVLIVWAFAMWRGWRGVGVGMAAAVVVAVSAFFGSASVHDRVMQGVVEARGFATVPKETSLGIRMVLYETTLELLENNLVFGLGTGAFKTHYSARAAEKYQGWQAKPADDPHNQYLFVTAENGLIGLATFLFMLASMVRSCLRSGSIYGKMAAGCLLAWCATSLFSGHFRTFPEGHLIAFIVGMLMVSRAPDGQQAGAAPADGAAA